MFYGTMNTDYSRFRAILLDLASGRVTETNLKDISFFLIQKNLTVRMVVQDACKTPTIVAERNLDNHIIYWTMNCEDWEYFYDYLDGFDAASYPCHQYYPFHYPEIVPMISKGEYSDDTFKEFF